MILNYKSYPKDKSTKREFFKFAETNFDEFDEPTRNEIIFKTENIFKYFIQIPNFQNTEEYIQNIIEMTNIVKEINLKIINESLLTHFFEHLFSIVGDHNIGQLIDKTRLFNAFADLILSLTAQEEWIVYQIIFHGFVKYTYFLITAPLTTRRDSDVYNSLACASLKSKRIRDHIIDKINIQRFRHTIRGIGDEVLLKSIFQLLASYTQFALTEQETLDTIFCFEVGLQTDYSSILPAISIGSYNLIRKASFIPSKLKKGISELFYLMTRRMTDDILIEYTIYMATNLLIINFNINIDLQALINFLLSDNDQIKIAAAYFFSHVAREVPQFFRIHNLDIIKCLNSLHQIYQSASHKVKVYLDETIMNIINLPYYNKDDLFNLFRNGFTETLVQMLQTSNADLLYNVVCFINDALNREHEINCFQFLSNQINELGGFDYLKDLINDPILREKNSKLAIIINEILNQNSLNN